MRRGVTVAASVAMLLTADASPALAHGIGVRGDLPLPLWTVAYGAAAVLVISFAVLGLRWRQVHLEASPPVVGLPAPVDRAARWLAPPLRLAGLVAVVAVWLAALIGPELDTQNLAPFAVFVALWVGVLVFSGLVGDLWRLLSPFESAARLLPDRDEVAVDTEGAIARVGVWPAAGLLLAFAWLELVYFAPSDPRVVGAAITVYVAVQVLGTIWFGRAWLRSAEAFGALFRVVAAMAPIHRDDAGRLRLRPPLVGLAHLRPVRGTAALVLVALGATTFDGLSGTSAWGELVGSRTGWAAVPIDTLGLVGTVAAVTGLYVWAMAEAARHTGRPVRELVDAFVHSLVPIAVAYVIAHYFSLLVFEGQRVLALASDPFGQGWDLLGTAGWNVDFTAVSTGAIAGVQVAAIVVGHLGGVVLAHDRALARVPEPRLATRSQLALLVAMVAYTIGGLVILLN